MKDDHPGLLQVSRAARQKAARVRARSAETIKHAEVRVAAALALREYADLFVQRARWRCGRPVGQPQ
jgi:hypothetical protein